MFNLIKIFLNIILLYLIKGSSTLLEEIKENSLVLLKDGTDQAIFSVTPGSKKMMVEIMLSHPSNYNFTFNQYDVEEFESYNEDEVLDFKEKLINPKRRPSTDYSKNQDGIIDNEIFYFGKNKYILNLSEDMKKIALTFFKKEENNNKELIYVRYKNIESHQVQKEKFTSGKSIKIEKDKDMINAKFDGIKLLDKNMNIDNVIVTYYIKLFDIEELKKKYENLYIYPFTNEVPLYSTEVSLKGNNILKKNYLRIKAPLNDKKGQYLFINVKINNLDEEEEQSFQYKYTNILVEEESKEKTLPQDKEGKNEEEKEKEKNFQEENQTKFYIILICNIVSVILTVIGIFIFIKMFDKKNTNIEEDNDYKDVQNNEKKDGEGNIEEEKNNEEEE